MNFYLDVDMDKFAYSVCIFVTFLDLYIILSTSGPKKQAGQGLNHGDSRIFGRFDAEIRSHMHIRRKTGSKLGFREKGFHV